jgi:hypothetical protein
MCGFIGGQDLGIRNQIADGVIHHTGDCTRPRRLSGGNAGESEQEERQEESRISERIDSHAVVSQDRWCFEIEYEEIGEATCYPFVILLYRYAQTLWILRDGKKLPDPPNESFRNARGEDFAFRKLRKNA